MLALKVSEARFVVAISEYNRRFILDHVGSAYADVIRVIHCGVDPGCFSPAQSRGEAFEFSCIGTLHEVKGREAGQLLETAL